MIIHCVKTPADPLTICGVAGMAPALDLESGSWQSWAMKFPEQLEEDGCLKCRKSNWKDIAMKIQKRKMDNWL